jgi:L-ascorbate metabolism protein UlaG (beta-lactamase superfamily)
MLLMVLIAIPLVALSLSAVLEQIDHQKLIKRVRNESLETIKADWHGNAIDQRDRFFDERYPYLPSMVKLLQWQLGPKPFKKEKHADRWRVDVRDPREFLASNQDGILWLGHASFYIRVGGTALLVDPVFGNPRFLRRWIDVPSPLEHIRDVDYVLVSHDHRDHMDEETLRAIAAKFPHAAFLGGLRTEDVLSGWTTASNLVKTAGWFQKFDIADPNIRIYFHPARHWSRRFLLDTNWRLWGSYVIQIGDQTIYFSGDSAYGEHFREAGELFPKIDYFLVAIGAYEPRWFMEPVHLNPVEAVRGFIDSKAGVMVPMHYGTFDLTDEPPSQPLRFTLEEAEKAGVVDSVRALAINDAVLMSR